MTLSLPSPWSRLKTSGFMDVCKLLEIRIRRLVWIPSMEYVNKHSWIWKKNLYSKRILGVSQRVSSISGFLFTNESLYTPVRHIVFDKEKQPTLNLLLARFYPPSYLKLSLKIRSTNKWRSFSGNRHMGVEKTKGVVLEKKIQRTKIREVQGLLQIW